MYFLFGVKLTKAEKAKYREHAILMRKSMSAANLDIETRIKNKNALDEFTKDYSPSWLVRMGNLSYRKNNPHTEAEQSSETRRARIMVTKIARQGIYSSRRRLAVPQDEAFGVRVPP